MLTIGPEVLQLLDDVLGLEGRGETLDARQALMGELVVTDSQSARIVAAVGRRFCIPISNADLEAGCLATVGSLVEFVFDRLT